MILSFDMRCYNCGNIFCHHAKYSCDLTLDVEMVLDEIKDRFIYIVQFHLLHCPFDIQLKEFNRNWRFENLKIT